MLTFVWALGGLYVPESGEGQEGQGLVEYALLLGFVAVVMFVALAFLRVQVVSAYSRIGSSIPTG